MLRNTTSLHQPAIVAFVTQSITNKKPCVPVALQLETQRASEPCSKKLLRSHTPVVGAGAALFLCILFGFCG